MNRKSVAERAKIIQLLVEGNSLRSTSRICDCSLNTVMKLLVDMGAACEAYQQDHLINLSCSRVEIDEIWSFVYAKDKNVKYGMEDYAGSVWTFTAICADTKLAVSWLVGGRTAESTQAFLADLLPRIDTKTQLTSDGFPAYKEAVEVLMKDVNYGMIYKMYDSGNGKYLGFDKVSQLGNPDKKTMTTAHVERQNLTMRMSMRRFTRKTNGHSKKIENHAHAVALHFFYYNFVRIHRTLKVTPAMAAGVTDRLWEIEDMIVMAVDSNYRITSNN